MNVLKRMSFAPRILKCPAFIRSYCDNQVKYPIEKSINHVTLMGRVGIDPQLRGTESKPVVVFTLATNSSYKYDTGELQQKAEWHRIVVFRPHLRDLVFEHLKKGNRVYVDGKILYGDYVDENGVSHTTTTIAANDVIFLGVSNKRQAKEEVEDAN